MGGQILNVVWSIRVSNEYGISDGSAKSESRLLQSASLQQEGLHVCQEKVGKDLSWKRQQGYQPVVAAGRFLDCSSI